MLQAGDKSSGQFHSICHHSQLPADTEQWPRCLEASAKLQLWSLQATSAWSDKTMKMKPVSTDCINFLPSFSEFLCDLKVFDHMMLACSFRFCSFFPNSDFWSGMFSLSLLWTSNTTGHPFDLVLTKPSKMHQSSIIPESWNNAKHCDITKEGKHAQKYKYGHTKFQSDKHTMKSGVCSPIKADMFWKIRNSSGVMAGLFSKVTNLHNEREWRMRTGRKTK